MPSTATRGSKVETSPSRQSRIVPLISERSLPSPLARIVLLAAEPVKASLRRAQTRHAALTEPAASRNPFILTRGNGSFWKPLQGDVSTLLQRGTFLLCRDTVNGNIKALLRRGRGYKNLRYLLLKAQRMAVTKTAFLVLQKAA